MGVLVRLLLVVGFIPMHVPVCKAGWTPPAATDAAGGKPASGCRCCKSCGTAKSKTPPAPRRDRQKPAKPECPAGCVLCSHSPVVLPTNPIREPRDEVTPTARLTTTVVPPAHPGHHPLPDRPPRV